jgi:UDP-glucose 4-epimerase
MQRILILGHSGFIGQYLFRSLKSSNPGVEVIGMSLSQIDLRRQDQVEKLAEVADSNTVIVVCAAIKRQFGDSVDTFNQNVDIVANLCRVWEKHPVSRVIYVSSAAVYGEDIHNTEITEMTLVQPRTFYGIGKYASECLLGKVIRAGGGELLVLRPPLIYGPGDTSESYGPVGFALKAVRGELITVWGDGTEQRNFVFVEDLARIVSRLVFSSVSGVLNIAHSESYTFKRILELLGELLSVDLDVSHRERSKEKVDNVYLNAKLMEAVGDFEFTSLRDGVLHTIEYLKANDEQTHV